jgi:hypothetical protein
VEFVDKFLNWLNYEDIQGGKGKSASKGGGPRRLLLEAPQAAGRIAEHCLPAPERLCEIAAAFEVKQRRKNEERYAAFLQLGFGDFVSWVETQVERSAESGGRGLMLTFDNSAGIVTATQAGALEMLGPVPYAVPVSHTGVQRLAYAAAEHFRKADFAVRVERIEGSFTRTSGQVTAAYDTVDIYWAETAV